MRWAVVVPSIGMGLPSAVEEAREVEEALPLPKNNGREKGRLARWFLTRGFWGLVEYPLAWAESLSGEE